MEPISSRNAVETAMHEHAGPSQESSMQAELSYDDHGHGARPQEEQGKQQQQQQPCDHFSIRSFVELVSKSNPKLYSLSDMVHDEQCNGCETCLPPLASTGFKRWDCDGCVNELTKSMNRVSVSGEIPTTGKNADAKCSIIYIRNTAIRSIEDSKISPSPSFRGISEDKSLQRMGNPAETSVSKSDSKGCLSGSDTEEISPTSAIPTSKGLEVDLDNQHRFGKRKTSQTRKIGIRLNNGICPSVKDAPVPEAHQQPDVVENRLSFGSESKSDKQFSQLRLTHRKKSQKKRLLSDIISTETLNSSRIISEFVADCKNGSETDGDESGRRQSRKIHKVNRDIVMKQGKRKRFKAVDVADDGSSLMVWLKKARKARVSIKKGVKGKYISSVGLEERSGASNCIPRYMTLNGSPSVTEKCDTTALQRLKSNVGGKRMGRPASAAVADDRRGKYVDKRSKVLKWNRAKQHSEDKLIGRRMQKAVEARLFTRKAKKQKLESQSRNGESAKEPPTGNLEESPPKTNRRKTPTKDRNMCFNDHINSNEASVRNTSNPAETAICSSDSKKGQTGFDLSARTRADEHIEDAPVNASGRDWFSQGTSLAGVVNSESFMEKCRLEHNQSMPTMLAPTLSIKESPTSKAWSYGRDFSGWEATRSFSGPSRIGPANCYAGGSTVGQPDVVAEGVSRTKKLFGQPQIRAPANFPPSMQPRTASSLVFEVNETVPATHLLMLMNSSRQSDFSLQHEPPNAGRLCVTTRPQRPTPAVSWQADQPQWQGGGSSCRPLRPLPRVGVLGEMLQKEITSWSEHCGTQSGLRIGHSEAPTLSVTASSPSNYFYRNITQSYNHPIYYSDHMWKPPTPASFMMQGRHFAENEPWRAITQPTKAAPQPARRFTPSVCLTNRNPADFTMIGADDEYMIGGNSRGGNERPWYVRGY